MRMPDTGDDIARIRAALSGLALAFEAAATAARSAQAVVQRLDAVVRRFDEVAAVALVEQRERRLTRGVWPPSLADR
jgi:hypothetical protein